MSSVSLDSDTFAQLVGHEFGPDGRVMLFRVSEDVATANRGEWSEPVQFRFHIDGSALVDLEMRAVDDHNIYSALTDLLDALERMYPGMHVSENVRQAYNRGRDLIPSRAEVAVDDIATGPLKEAETT